jgi:hypothetical protein
MIFCQRSKNRRHRSPLWIQKPPIVAVRDEPVDVALLALDGIPHLLKVTRAFFRARLERSRALGEPEHFCCWLQENSDRL